MVWAQVCRSPCPNRSLHHAVGGHSTPAASVTLGHSVPPSYHILPWAARCNISANCCIVRRGPTGGESIALAIHCILPKEAECTLPIIYSILCVQGLPTAHCPCHSLHRAEQSGRHVLHRASNACTALPFTALRPRRHNVLPPPFTAS